MAAPVAGTVVLAGTLAEGILDTPVDTRVGTPILPGMRIQVATFAG